ncbi:hypothetical protein DOM22_05355 [Bdellovibrio sp. ZAP7]|uniref:helix-turn-helix domain-containing protein n=1 Tax=Bdellovibrio sp. ZAP7 TaxID=2231053 RepID=UPI0011597272|nr:helix-turn-helix domain-containing protein [Bdellovibrio sp. ZAP7]QDK44628.1 hypothetical protein DOM22_05355 [Bdellovibrio sp. ZAP7]
MNSKEIPTELLSLVGSFLRQGRKARNLLLPQAAQRIGISAERLQAIEDGLELITTEYAQFIVANYGGARGDAVDGLLWRLMMERNRCHLQTERRKHLSVVGEESRPWEKLQFSKISCRSLSSV